jgi:hypothetical protein
MDVMDGPGGVMSNQRPEYFRPALIAGAAAGILSGIPFINCLCCLWIIGGAVLAAHLLARRTPGPLTAGDGAIVGALTGMAASVADSFISIPLRPFNEAFTRRLLEGLGRFSDQMPAGWQELMDRSRSTGLTAAGFLFGLFISAAIFAILGVLGGVIGVSLFGRKKTATPGAQSPQGPPDAAV